MRIIITLHKFVVSGKLNSFRDSHQNWQCHRFILDYKSL